jgi:hypothetical protein
VVSTEGQNVKSRSEKNDLLPYSKLDLIVVLSTLNYVSVSNFPAKSGQITDFWVIWVEIDIIGNFRKILKK